MHGENDIQKEIECLQGANITKKTRAIPFRIQVKKEKLH